MKITVTPYGVREDNPPYEVDGFPESADELLSAAKEWPRDECSGRVYATDSLGGVIVDTPWPLPDMHIYPMGVVAIGSIFMRISSAVWLVRETARRQTQVLPVHVWTLAAQLPRGLWWNRDWGTATFETIDGATRLTVDAASRGGDYYDRTCAAHARYPGELPRTDDSIWHWLEGCEEEHYHGALRLSRVDHYYD